MLMLMDSYISVDDDISNVTVNETPLKLKNLTVDTVITAACSNKENKIINLRYKDTGAMEYEQGCLIYPEYEGYP